MMSSTSLSDRLAEIAGWVLGPPALAVLAAAAATLLDPRSGHPAEHSVAGMTALLAAAILAWALLSMVAARLALLPVLPRLARRALARSVERLGTGQARRTLARQGSAVALGAGLAVGSLAPAALASPAPPPDDLSWGAQAPAEASAVSGDAVLPGGPGPTGPLRRAADALVAREALARPADRDDPPPLPAPATHLVVPGESLWSIAADLVSPSAGDAGIARLWPAIHAANADLIGEDPSLIRPGQVLVIPQARP
ncbi:LysM peptidoglycan-binding domain-containing protein [Schaalia naturae]|uniref:LysM peptidoglycan-binding domain-containing protein n=3 Tax=Schaalia naturae TaxID=635203 RepID=A0ABW2SJ89_9ACTO